MRARTRNVMGRRALQKALLVCILATVTSLRAPTPALRSTHGRRYAANVWDDLPEPCRQALDARGLAAPLPVQTRSYAPVFEGLDAVVQSPTATGKTLAYVAPLVARLASAERPPRAGRGPAAPRVLVLAPSRELATQIGAEWASLCGPLAAAAPRVAVVVGGTPLERSVGALRRGGGCDVLVGTAGRTAELLRQGRTKKTARSEVVLGLDAVETIILDEADQMLDEDDVPEVRRFMDAMERDYQLVLFSATITDKVRKFARGTMELEHGSADVDLAAAPRVDHASLACVRGEWHDVALEVLREGGDALSLVFVRTIADATNLHDLLSRKLPRAVFDVLLLHGDMNPEFRKRVFRAARRGDDTGGRRAVLVATDVAARGLDLPGVGLVVQLGAPRKAGKEGTLDGDLYAHRAGRGARDAAETATSLLLFDPSAGERPLVAALADDFPGLLPPRPPPRPAAVLENALGDALRACAAAPATATDAVAATVDGLSDDERRDALAAALAILAGVDDRPPAPRSLLTCKPTDRTLRFESAAGGLDPKAVMAACKALGSGKLGVVRVVDGGAAALVDVPAKKVAALVAAAESGLPDGWAMSLPES